MEKKIVSLVPYKSYLAPKNATHVRIHPVIPTSMGYQGKVAVAITQEAFYIVTPHGNVEQVPFVSIKDVKTENFPGFVYPDDVDGIPTLVAPNDTTGVTIEYHPSGGGNLTHRISFLTGLPNIAHQWVRLITQAINEYNLRRREEFITGDEEDQ